MNYKELLQQIKSRYQTILADVLIGIYIHGSIAFGCYNEQKSDIDFLVVVKEKLSVEIKKQLIQVLIELTKEAPKKGFEMSVLCLKDCQKIAYPTPFDLHFSNMHLEHCKNDLDEYCEHMNGLDEDLAAHIVVTKSAGIVLYGLPINEVFAEVPEHYYLHSIKNDIENAVEEIVENPVYIILNLCRVLAYIADRCVLSKKQGGEWGMLHLPVKYQELVRKALVEYESVEVGNCHWNLEESKLREFAEYMHHCIFKVEY